MDTGLAAEDRENFGKSSRCGQETSDLIRQSREEYGRYFGICGSYHHLKACICKNCPSYSGGSGMFCSRSKSPGQGKKKGCLCETCELYRKFRLEGEYFCIKAEKSDVSEEKPEFSPGNSRKTPACSGKTRVCVVEE